MCDIIDLIEADHLHIMHWAARLGELRHQGSRQEPSPALAMTWQTVAALIELHMRADEEICGPAVLLADAQGRVLAREIRDAREDIREIIRETRLQPTGSPPWWDLARAALAAWAVQLDVEAHGPLAERRRRADPALRERLASQWRAFTEGYVRDRYPQAPPDIPTHQLRQDSQAPATVPRLADPAFGPLACTCRACTRTLDWMILSNRRYLRPQAGAAKDQGASGSQPSPHSQRPARPNPGKQLHGTPTGAAGDGSGPKTARTRTAAAAGPPSGRESLMAGWPARTVWILGWAATVTVAAADAALGEHPSLIGLLVIGPCCAALTGRWMPTGLIGLWVIGLALTLCLPDGIWGEADCYAWLALVTVVALACTAAAAFIQGRSLVRCAKRDDQIPADSIADNHDPRRYRRATVRRS